MTTDAPSLPSPARRDRLAWRALGRLGRGWAWPMAAGLAAGAGLLHLAGPWAVAAPAAGAALLAVLAQAVARPGADSSTIAPDARAWSTRPEQEREREIVSQAVPVWRRNVEAARAHSERSMETLLASFASVNDHLDRAIGATGTSPLLEAGAIDKLLANHQPLLDTLLHTTREAVRMKDEMLDTVTGMAASLDALAELSKEVQTISRATHLLALNASVEATRGGSDTGNGFAVIAREVRELAADSRKAGVGIGRRVMQLQEQMNALRNGVRRQDTSEQEITLQAEECAREVVSSVLRSVSEVTRASRGIRTASRQVQAELEKIFMGLQSQDRLSQMLTSVTDDMGRLDLWMSGTPDPSATSAQEWLARLENSYTMEELRSSHHGTVVVERQATVEFF